ncbi:uncharacterized protein LOC108024600 isoform X2 [Drosophila biarmipes]|uniref:uncharacterized protein LOC108024600 isoform X2 n=1 Tax=Drosophila biarmipes TaxID=125945 RepID=UPI001CDAA71B|nr:uncharacterized protein LOC108024600 isoform X2 [Drosophila biarmipes]
MVNVPPLLCSTPPPIDFGEEDDDSGLQSTIHLDEGDEYSNFGLVSSSKEPPPPPDPVGEFREKPPDLQENKQTAEAFNYQVKQAMDYDVFGVTAPPTPPPLSLELEEEELEEQVPSLKLDSLSLYSTESVSAASTLSPVAETEPEPPAAVMQTTKAHVLSHQFTLEDVSDDSDEECSPKKPKELFIREGAVDFFAIEVLASPTIPNGEGFPEEDQDAGKIVSQEITSQQEERFNGLENQEESSPNLANQLETHENSSSDPKTLEETPNHWGKPADSNSFQFANFEEPPEDLVQQDIVPNSQEPEEDDDFGDFADFSAAEPETQNPPAATAPLQPVFEAPPSIETEPIKAEKASTVEASIKIPPSEQADDGFDDFQEFATPTNGSAGQSDDDDFGDFSEPVVAAVSLPPPPPPAAVQLSIDERVKPVLEMMFPQSKELDSSSVDKRKPLAQCQRFNFGAIEHAQALDYQWSSSEMRHALVRSLGIDSRNILFGDKWNSSMPRFAANLSFDPLKPMKPLSTGTGSTLEVISSPSSHQESHVQTLQLEQLDQLTVVANADKINLVTSNSHTNNNNNDNGENDVAAPVDQLDDKPPVMDLMATHNNHNLTIDLHHLPPLTHFATICNNNNNNNDNNYLNNLNNNHDNNTATMTIPINTKITAHDALLDFRLENATAATASQAETRSSPSHGEGTSGSIFGSAGNSDGEERQNHSYQPAAISGAESNHIESATAPPAAIASPAAATLSTALPADSPAHQLNGGEQLHQQRAEQEQFDLRTTSSPAPPAQEEIVGSSMASYAVPLKETHIYTPSKSDTAVAKTTTLAPIDFDYEMAATGIIIDETVVKKEYRDVEYKPPFGLDSPSKVSGNGAASSFELPPPAEDDDFSDFQSMPAPRSRIDTPTFGEQMILSPAILLPQAIPLAKKPAASIEWGDNALSSINAEEMARIEELFSSQAKPLTISASVAKKPTPPTPVQSQPQEDDEWSDFVSVPVTQQQHQQHTIANNNNNVSSNQRKPTAPKEDEWSDFVSSTPPARAAPQFNSGAWQSANFYNNPLSLYQAQQPQQHPHSNLVPKSSSSSASSNNNNVPAIPQQIHIMHDFSTAPVSGGLGVGATYQQQHQRQQFQIGNAKVAPRISLIPDLSFVAPALPTNAGAFMGTLPKPSFGGKK